MYDEYRLVGQTATRRIYVLHWIHYEHRSLLPDFFFFEVLGELEREENPNGAIHSWILDNKSRSVCSFGANHAWAFETNDCCRQRS